ncbi:unnamed protein product [Ostreobium quekettii]|uniref:Uncharacterized protein n=1 Tax=Ostreobium quekettii TaxID=121088 RepID=A0A8S1IS03_9CHLO|nr:unnamed protein product [Ostreobium quekettii]
MKQVFTAANENEDFRSFLMDPVTSRKNKMQGMEAMLTDMGMSEVTKRFFMVLAENGRMRDAQKVWETFGTLMQAHGKQVKGMVTSAEPLPPGELSEVRESLQKLLGEGETLLLDQKVDPDIIGGLVVELGDKYIDLSVEKRIRDMERLLMEAI